MNRARRWSSPAIAIDASAGDAFIANLGAALRLVEANAPGAAEGRDPEYLHELRAGLRRLRSTLRAFRPLLQRRKAADCDRRLRETLHALGPARDWDVFRRSLGRGALAIAAQQANVGAQRRVRSILRSARFGSALRELRTWHSITPWRAHADPDQPVAAFARRALRRLRKGLQRSAEGIDWSDTVQRHKVRIRAKRLRYGCECFAAAYRERGAGVYLKRLRKLQRILGEMNDLAVQRMLLEELARDARLRKSAARLSAVLAAREGVRATQARHRWRRLESTPPFWLPPGAAP